MSLVSALGHFSPFFWRKSSGTFGVSHGVAGVN